MKLLTATALVLLAAPAMADDITVIFSFEREILKEGAPNVFQHHMDMRTESNIGNGNDWCDRHFFGFKKDGTPTEEAGWQERETSKREENGWITQVATCNGRDQY